MFQLTYVTLLSRSLQERLHYPGETHYLALICGPGGEIWFDDHHYTGIAGISMQDFAVAAGIEGVLPLMLHRDPSTLPSWLLLNREDLTLFIGDCTEVERFLAEHQTSFTASTPIHTGETLAHLQECAQTTLQGTEVRELHL